MAPTESAAPTMSSSQRSRPGPPAATSRPRPSRSPSSSAPHPARISSLVVIAVVWVVVAAWAALVPFIFGLLVAYILLPVVNWLDDHAPRFLRRRALARPLAIVRCTSW